MTDLEGTLPVNVIDWEAEKIRAHRISVEHGWHDEPRSWKRKCWLIGTEVYEAAEAFRKDPPATVWDHVAEEMIDVIIRALDTAAARNAPLVGKHLDRWRASACDPEEFDELLDDSLETLHDLIARLFKEGDDPVVAGEVLSRIIGVASRSAGRFGADAPAVLDAKQRANEARPHRHGGRRA